jgi:hypothetical protein
MLCCRTMPHVLQMADQMQRALHRPGQQEQEEGVDDNQLQSGDDGESKAQQESGTAGLTAPPSGLTPPPRPAASETAQHPVGHVTSGNTASDASSTPKGQATPDLKQVLKAQVPSALQGVNHLIPSAHI